MLPSSSLIPQGAPTLVRTARLAKWLGVPSGKILEWVRCGVLPEPSRLGKRTLLHHVDKVRAALDERARIVAARLGHPPPA